MIYSLTTKTSRK